MPYNYTSKQILYSETNMTKALNRNYYNDEKLSKDELLFFKKALEEKREKIEKNVKLTSNNVENGDKCHLKDEADQASNLIDTHTTNAIIKEQTKSLNQINRCLNKIATGRYGICNMCEETIDIERLKVKIFAEYCISCREIIEQQ